MYEEKYAEGCRQGIFIQLSGRKGDSRPTTSNTKTPQRNSHCEKYSGTLLRNCAIGDRCVCVRDRERVGRRLVHKCRANDDIISPMTFKPGTFCYIHMLLAVGTLSSS